MKNVPTCEFSIRPAAPVYGRAAPAERSGRDKKQDGFKAHVVVEPDTGLVTAAALTKASGADNSDAARGAELLAADTSIGDGPVQVLADSAYGSGELLAQLTAAGRQPIIKPTPLARAVPGGFTIDNFTVNEVAGVMTAWVSRAGLRPAEWCAPLRPCRSWGRHGRRAATTTPTRGAFLSSARRGARAVSSRSADPCAAAG